MGQIREVDRLTRGEITYDSDYNGHICTCTRKLVRDEEEEDDYYSYKPTVKEAREIEPTESGSWWYVCSSCGAGAWSGA